MIVEDVFEMMIRKPTEINLRNDVVMNVTVTDFNSVSRAGKKKKINAKCLRGRHTYLILIQNTEGMFEGDSDESDDSPSEGK